MKHRNATRNALFTSIMSLLLCVSMLVGTTFAWFTDSVESGINTIAAGNLDVELYHGKDANPVDQVKNDTLLFTDAGGNVIDLWEPGVVAFTNLKVANEGTLALKYQLSINSTEMNTVAGTDLTLADALQVAVVKGGVSGTREQVIGAVDASAWTKLESFTLSEVLEADKKSDTYGIVIYWEPGENDHDNLFNMNNGKTTSDGKPLTITLGVNLFATQEMYEDDSFGPDYDEDAWGEGFDVYTEQDLNAAIANGETAIDLMGDINLTETLEIPEGAKLTLNLNGKTLTGPGRDDEGNKVHALTNNGSLELVGGTVKSEAANGGSAIYNEEGATLTLKDVTVVGAPQDANNTGAWPSYAINNYGDMTIKGADITSAHGAISVYGDTVIEDANVTVNGRGGSSHVFYIGGEGTDLIVHGGTYTHKGNTDGSLAYIMTGTTMTVNGGTFTASNGGYGLATYTGSLTVNGGTFANAFLDWGGPISIAGGTFATKPADKYIAAGYKAVNVNGTYHVVPEDITLIYDTASLNAALADGANKVQLLDGVYEADLYNISSRDSLTITGNGAGTKLNFKKGQVRTDLFNKLTIENCTIGRMVDKSWGQLVFSSSTVAGGVYTVSNCIFDGQATQGIYINQSNVDATYNILNCTFNGDFGNEGAITIQDNNCEFTVNVTDCEFNNIPETSHEIWAVTSDPATKVEYGTWKLYVDGELAAVNAAQLANAVANGATDIYLMDGEYDIKECGGKTLTLTGSKDAVLKVYNEGEDGCDYGFGGPGGVGDITFNGLTIDTTANTGNYKGYAYMKGTFNDCNFVGAYSLNNANDFVFNRCTFDFKNGYFWTWGANSVTFDGCTFNGNSKAILAHGSSSTVININNCTFAATEKGYTSGGDNTAVVEMDPVGSNTYTINFTGENTITDSYAGWTRVKDGSTGHVINGLN